MVGEISQTQRDSSDTRYREESNQKDRKLNSDYWGVGVRVEWRISI